VISELEQQAEGCVWLPGLRTLAMYGLVGPAT